MGSRLYSSILKLRTRAEEHSLLDIYHSLGQKWKLYTALATQSVIDDDSLYRLLDNGYALSS